MKHSFSIINSISPFFTILLGVLSFSSCNFNCISVEGTGPMANKTFNIGSFNSVESDISATINLTQSDIVSVEVLGQQNILDLLEIRVEDNKLLIDYSQQCVMSSFDSLIINVTAPEITAIHLNGSGKINAKNNLNSKDLNLSIDGSGTIAASVTIDSKIKASISGSGDMFLSGNTSNAELDISGSGEIHAFDLIAKTVSVEISGSGDAEINASEELEARVSGSGDIKYKGSPQVNTSISGSGDVIKLD